MIALRGQRVILDSDLAGLYGVESEAGFLKRALVPVPSLDGVSHGREPVPEAKELGLDVESFEGIYVDGKMEHYTGEKDSDSIPTIQ